MGVILIVVGVLDIIDIKNKAGDIKTAAAAQAGGDQATMDALANMIKISSSFGLWLVVIGGIVLLIGGIMAITMKRGLPSVAAAPDAAAG